MKKFLFFLNLFIVIQSQESYQNSNISNNTQQKQNSNINSSNTNNNLNKKCNKKIRPIIIPEGAREKFASSPS